MCADNLFTAEPQRNAEERRENKTPPLLWLFSRLCCEQVESLALRRNFDQLFKAPNLSLFFLCAHDPMDSELPIVGRLFLKKLPSRLVLTKGLLIGRR